ncbi:MAG: glycosyltransferase family 4 protein [Acidimicrobiia bacterium]
MTTTERVNRLESAAPGRPDRRTSLVIVREQVEDREIANFLPLVGEFDIRLVTSATSGPYAASGLGIPSTSLARFGDALKPRFLRRRLRDRLAPRFDLDRLRGFGAAVRDADVICINENHMVSSLQAVQAKEKHPHLRIVNVCYENIAFNYDADPILRTRRERVRAATDLFVAMSPSTRDALVTEGVSTSRIAVIPYGVDPNRFGDRGDRPSIRSELGISDDDIVFTYTGRLLREKGLAELLAAFAELQVGSARLLIVGSGPESGRLRGAAAALGVSGLVHFLGWATPDRVAGLLAASDAFVLPSLPTPYWEEQLGFSLVEAMATGLACIGTDTGSIPFILGDAGVVVRPYDKPSLSGALRRLTVDPTHRAELGVAARRRVQTELSVETVSARLREAIVTA